MARASATMPVAGRTHYEVLGVGARASRGEIKAAYRRLAREVHPDGAGGGGNEGFIGLHAAYATLADPDERALRLGRGRPRRGHDDAAGWGGGASVPAEDMGDRPVLVGRPDRRTHACSAFPFHRPVAVWFRYGAASRTCSRRRKNRFSCRALFDPS